MTSHQRGWFIITSLLTWLVFLLMFWVSLLELFLSLIDPSFASIYFSYPSIIYGVGDIQPACSHCTPQLANHAAFVISTIWTDTDLSHSPFLSHLDREIALEGWEETAICQGHRLHCAICHGVRVWLAGIVLTVSAQSQIFNYASHTLHTMEVMLGLKEKGWDRERGREAKDTI